MAPSTIVGTCAGPCSELPFSPPRWRRHRTRRRWTNRRTRRAEKRCVMVSGRDSGSTPPLTKTDAGERCLRMRLKCLAVRLTGPSDPLVHSAPGISGESGRLRGPQPGTCSKGERTGGESPEAPEERLTKDLLPDSLSWGGRSRLLPPVAAHGPQAKDKDAGHHPRGSSPAQPEKQDRQRPRVRAEAKHRTMDPYSRTHEGGDRDEKRAQHETGGPWNRTNRIRARSPSRPQ